MSPAAPPLSNAMIAKHPLCTTRNLLKGAAITVCVNTGIALMLWWANAGGLTEQMVYSQGIGLSIWAFVNLGALWLARPTDPGGFPRGWRAALMVPVAVALGTAVGTTLGNVYAGRPAQLLVSANPRMAWMMLVMTFVIGGAMTLYFYLAGKSNYLQVELERTQRQNAEAQLKLLESQLEPHMLFNTLANLRVLIGLDPAKAQTMLDHMIAYLRATLSATRNGAHTHTLATEFERLNDYLALMAFRMGPRLQVSLDLPEHLREVPIPPLLLQPLVENAILHGLEPKVEGGHITVSAHTQPGAHGQQVLWLCVTDTGVGLGTHETQEAPGTGFGTAQVRERLFTTYGPTAGLELVANKTCGSSAKVQIELKK